MESKEINLLVFARDYPVGMAGTKRIQHFLEYLMLRDVNIKVISFRSKTEQPAIKGVHKSIPYFNIGLGIDMKLSQMHRIIAYYFKGFRAISEFRKAGCSNILYNSGGINIENFLFILWSRILSYRLILAIEEDYSFFKDNIKAISKFKCWTIRRFDFLNCRWADKIVAISTYLKEKYDRLKGSGVVLIPITANLNIGQNRNSINSPLRVIYAGTFADKDGVDDIINGFLEFNKTFRDARLILTGKSAQQQIYVNRYKDENNIHFAGFVEDMEFYSLLRDADVLCMCRTESGFANAGFPFKLGEYLATGNPVICTRVSDVEQYLDENDAFLIEPGSPEQISEALCRIAADPESARKRGLNGLEKCRRFFSPEANGKLLYDVLISLSRHEEPKKVPSG